MNTSRKIAIAVGALFLAGYVGVFGGGFLAEPILNAPDFPANIATDRSRLLTGLFMELIVNDVAVLGIGILLFLITLGINTLATRLVGSSQPKRRSGQL